jgi:hypothetical protein
MIVSSGVCTSHTPFELMHLSAQLFHLLLQALIFCSKRSILSLQVFDLFFLTHDSI